MARRPSRESYSPDLEGLQSSDLVHRRRALNELTKSLYPILQNWAKYRSKWADSLFGCSEYDEFFVGDTMSPRSRCEAVNSAYIHVVEQIRDGKYDPQRNPNFPAWVFTVADHYLLSLLRHDQYRVNGAEVALQQVEDVLHDTHASPEQKLFFTTAEKETQAFLTHLRETDRELTTYLDICIAMYKDNPEDRIDLAQVALAMNVEIARVYYLRRRAKRVFRDWRKSRH